MLVKLAEVTDILKIQDVANISWRDTYKEIFDLETIEMFLSKAYSEKMLKQRLEKSFLFVAYFEGILVGFINFSRVHKGKSEVVALYVHPDYQGEGYGTKLLEAYKYFDSDLKTLELIVEEENTKAYNFYTNIGFEEKSRFEEDFLGHKMKSILMRKIINC